MKKYLVLFIASLFCLSASGQKSPVKVLGEILYDVTHVTDTLTNDIFRETGITSFSRDVFMYQSYDQLQGQAAVQRYYKGGSVGPFPVVRGTKSIYYAYLQGKQMVRVNRFNGTTYRMEEPLEDIKWNITREAKTIGNYTCQKANGVCRGRMYTAWFCSDLPFSAGPWKLHGLPGLILEAYDTRARIQFRFRSIDLKQLTVAVIEPTVSFLEIGEAEFEKMRMAYFENPPKSGVSGTLRNMSGEIVKPKLPVSNNPIDQVSKLPRLIM